MTIAKCYVAAMFLIAVIISDVHTAEYADYDGGSISGSEGRGSHDFYDALEQSDDLSSTKLWNIPFQHLMVRKSQRSPSFRLRFGRRSDPMLSNDLSNGFLTEDAVERKSVRSPSYRLRFGRRSDPELSEDFMVRKASRSPSLRLRFGRRSDPLMNQDLTNSFLREDYVDKKMIRSPSFRLRFGRQSDTATSMEDLPAGGTTSEKETSTGVEEN